MSLPQFRCRRWTYTLAAALLVLAAADPARAADTEHWYSVHFDGRKIGHYLQRRALRDGLVHTEQRLQLALLRNGTPLVVRSRQLSIETVDGAPLGFQTELDLGGSIRRSRGERIGETLTMRRDDAVGPRERAQQRPWPPHALLAEGQRLHEREQPLAPGRRYTLSVFDPSVQRAQRLHSEVLGAQTIDVHGHAEPLIAIRRTVEAVGPLIEAWVRESDRVLRRLRVPALGLRLEMLACDRDCALAPDQPTDVLQQATLDAPRALTTEERAAPLRYRLRLAEAAAQALHGLAGQQIDVDPAGVLHLQVDPGGGADAPPGPQDLAATRWLQSDAAELQAMQRRAVGRSRDPLRRMQRLERAVRAHIGHKSLQVGYGSALDAWRDRAGDCTEHAVLLAALARAAGIPARVASGLAYAPRLGDRTAVFIPHAWVFAWIDGRWRGFDAALSGYGSGHLAFEAGDGDPFGFHRGADLLGRLQIEAIEAAPVAAAVAP